MPSVKDFWNDMKNAPSDKAGVQILKKTGFRTGGYGTWYGILDGRFMMWNWSDRYGWGMPQSWDAEPGRTYGNRPSVSMDDKGKVVWKEARVESAELSLTKILCEAVDTARAKRLDAGTRSQANRAMEKSGLDGNGRFASVSLALGKAWESLTDLGLQPDEVISKLFKGSEGRFSQRIAWKNDDDPYSPVEISNSMLAMFWTKLDDDKYEVIAYLS